MEHARDRPEELAQESPAGGGARRRLVKMRGVFFAAGGVFVYADEARLGATYFALDLCEFGEAAPHDFGVERLEVAQLLLQRRQLGASLREQRFESFDFERRVGRLALGRGRLQMEARHGGFARPV
ncbi:MAG: hypothetical protein DMF65_14105 [Acidobacteria bacterium]|nr:MAG: hypothetical protein DMF65_14105 [Acidobacteriota bacterium]